MKKKKKQKECKIEHRISIYFGAVGSGKSSFAAWLARKDLKRNGKVWSNFPISGCMEFDKSDLGKYNMQNGRIIWDETGIDADNRNYAKNWTKDQVAFLKLHRHYQVAIDCFSQGFDDMDKKIRVLAQKMYIVKKSILPWFVYRKEIRKKFAIDDNTKQPIDAYEFVPFSRKYIFCPPVWKMFNTLERPPLPEKEWRIYE